MRNIFIVLACLLFMFACKKEETPSPILLGDITGKWNWDTVHVQLLKKGVVTVNTQSAYYATGDVYFTFMKDGQFIHKTSNLNAPPIMRTYTYDPLQKRINVTDTDNSTYFLTVNSLTDTRMELGFSRPITDDKGNDENRNRYVLKKQK